MYIDDLFIILFSRDKLQETITSLQNSFDNLKLNIEHGEEVVFLDLKIFLSTTQFPFWGVDFYHFLN